MTLRRRLAKIEAIINPNRAPLPTVLHEPAEDATDEEWATFEQDLAAAKAGGLEVLVVVGGPTIGRERDGVRYVSDVEAALTVLSRQPSERGKGSALDDVLRSLGGKVLGVSTALPA
jgi:hypothetical protein